MKRTIIIFLTIFMFCGSIMPVFAKKIEVLSDETKTVEALANISAECDSMLGNPEDDDELAYYLQMALEIIKYAGIILCIVLTIVDFAKALLGEDKEMYKPLAKTAFTRLAYAVVLFFLPAIVNTLMLLLGAYDTCGIK